MASQSTLPSTELRHPEQGLAVLTLLGHVLRQKRSIAIITGISVLVGVALSLILPVRFTATTRLLSPQPTPSAMNLMMNQQMNASAASLLNSTGGAFLLKNPNDLYIGLLRSRPVADAIIRQFGLANVYELNKMASVRKRLASLTTISSEKSGFLSISVTDSDKARAAQIANAYTYQLRVLTKDLALTEAGRRRAFYEGELKHATDNLISAELSFQQMQRKKGLVQLDAQANVLIQGMAELRAQIAGKEVQLQALRLYSTDENPDVQITANQVASLREQLAKMEQRDSSSPGSAGLGLHDIAGAGLDYLHAEHELQYRQALLDLLMKQLDAARLDEAKDAAIIQVVEEAVPPEERSSPRRLTIILISLLVGLFGSFVFLYMSQRVHLSPELWRSLSELRTEATTGWR